MCFDDYISQDMSFSRVGFSFHKMIAIFIRILGYQLDGFVQLLFPNTVSMNIELIPIDEAVVFTSYLQTRNIII